MTLSPPRWSVRPEEAGQRAGHAFRIVLHRDMAGGPDPHEPGFRHLAGEAFRVVDGLEFVVLAPDEKFWVPRAAHRGQQLHRVAFVCGAGERDPGPRDTRLSPGIEILRDL